MCVCECLCVYTYVRTHILPYVHTYTLHLVLGLGDEKLLPQGDRLLFEGLLLLQTRYIRYIRQERARDTWIHIQRLTTDMNTVKHTNSHTNITSGTTATQPRQKTDHQAAHSKQQAARSKQHAARRKAHAASSKQHAARSTQIERRSVTDESRPPPHVSQLLCIRQLLVCACQQYLMASGSHEQTSPDLGGLGVPLVSDFPADLAKGKLRRVLAHFLADAAGARGHGPH